MESDTTHHGSRPPALKYASASLLRRMNQNPIPAIKVKYAPITTKSITFILRLLSAV
jgi:hypothetical protein